MQYLDFEKNIAELESKVNDLKQLDPSENEISIGDNIKQLEEKASKALEKLYSTLSPWQKTKVARHPERPHFRDYIDNLFDDFIELSGDRKYSNDHAIIGGLAKFNGFNVMIIGHEKGANTSERIKHNFGMAGPEGYRKAERLMKLADRFNLPIITFVDTAGAYPGIGAEERGQSEAIARCTQTCLNVTVPIISIIIGEGGSGGAIALASSSKVIMLENAIYSVISPEGCATILWRDPKKMLDAAKAMKLSAKDLLKLKVIDEIILEPLGGAHRDRNLILNSVAESISKNLESFKEMLPEEIFNHRKNKFLKIGRGKGFMTNPEDLSSLKIQENKFDKILKLKKNFIVGIGITLILLASLIYIL